MQVFPAYNAVHSIVDRPAPYQKTEFPSDCEHICLALADCDMAVWHEASVNQVWGNVCVTLTHAQMVDAGRVDQSSWVQQPEVVTMVKECTEA